jgi:hypothetical protein
MNKTKQLKDFIFRCTRCLKSSQQWIEVSLEGFEGSLDTSDEALLTVCLLLIKKTDRVLPKLHEWLEENPQSEDYHKVVYLVGGFRKLLASWSSGNILK